MRIFIVHEDALFMENNIYSLEDIKKFISDYREDQSVKQNDWMINIPLVGKKIYEKAALEEQKRCVFERAYENALNGSIEEQEEFIKQMTPVLDDFYSNNEIENVNKR